MAREVTCTLQQLNPKASISREVDVNTPITDADSPPAGWGWGGIPPQSTLIHHTPLCGGAFHAFYDAN